MIDVVRVVTILIFAIFVACGAYQVFIERSFERSDLTDIQHFIPRAVTVASIFQIVATATNLSSQLDYSPVILILSDLSYDAATLVSYGVLFVLVQLTLKNASLAANMVGEKDENRVERARIVLFALWLVLLAALITAQIVKAAMDRVAYSSIYLLSLAAVMLAMIVIVLRFLYQVRPTIRIPLGHRRLSFLLPIWSRQYFTCACALIFPIILHPCTATFCSFGST
jgi:hypothetical protein